MSYITESIIYLCFQFLPFITGLVRWKHIDPASRTIVAIAGISSITECLGLYASIRFQNNLPVYNIASLIIVSALTLYFWLNLDFLRRKNVGLIFILINITLWLFSVFYINSIRSENLFYTNYEIFVFVFLSVLFLERQIVYGTYSRLYLNPHFYFTLLFVFAWTGSFVQWNLYNYMNATHPSYMHVIDFFLTMLSIIVNVGFSLVLFYYPKLKTAQNG